MTPYRGGSSELSPQAAAVLATAPPASIPMAIDETSAPLIRAAITEKNSAALAQAMDLSQVTSTPVTVGGATVIQLDPPERPAAEDDDYLVYVHGGAFVVGDPVDPIGLGLTKATGLRCYSIPYGLAPEHRFPVALDQVEAAWEAITQRAGRPVLVGTSAGGTLVLGLLQRLLARTAVLPAAVVLFTPAADLRGPTDDRLVNEGRDPIVKWSGLVDKAVDAYLGAHDRDDPEVSPVLGDYRDLRVPTLLVTAELDLLRPDVHRLHEVLSGHGVPVDLDDAPGLWHAYQQIPTAPESQQSLERVASFITSSLTT